MEKGRKNIFLTGFMGSGKSSVGKLLAKKLSKTFVDLDDLIQEKYGMSINEIFKTYGEDFFREKESEILKIISEKKDLIISLGGGTLVRLENLRTIKEQGTVVYLKTELATVLKRLSNEYEKRPLLKNKKPQDIKNLYDARKNQYEQSDCEVVTDELSLTEVTDKVLESIKRCREL